MCPGRATYIGLAWRSGVATGEVLPALGGIATHAARSVLDVATLAVGLNRQMQLSRLKAVSPAIAQEWQRLQDSLAEPFSHAAGSAG